jgi:hypothetical protein
MASDPILTAFSRDMGWNQWKPRVNPIAIVVVFVDAI